MSHPTDLQQARDAIRHWAKLSDEADHDIDAPYLELIKAVAAALARARRETWEQAAQLAGQDSSLDHVGGSTGNAKGTSVRIALLCRRQAAKDLPHD